MIRFLTLGVILISDLALACASCGSGGGNPLVLYPNENQKFLVGLSRQTNINEIKSNGGVYTPTVRHRDQSLLAGGVQFDRRFQFTAALPYITNRTADGRQFTALGDYGLGFRYTFLQQTFMEPNKPQIQLQLDHKPIYANSVFNYERVDGLDITGSGLASTTLGMDIWWGMRRFMFGGLVSSTINQERFINEHLVERGNSNEVVGTIGYLVSKSNLVTTGIGITQKSEDKDDGQIVDQSESNRGDIFFSLRFKPIPLEEWRISYRLNGVSVFRNYNTTRQESLSASYAKVL